MDGGDDASESDDVGEQLDAEERALRAERGQLLAQTKDGFDFASARMTFVNGDEGQALPDVRQSNMNAMAALQGSASLPDLPD